MKLGDRISLREHVCDSGRRCGAAVTRTQDVTFVPGLFSLDQWVHLQGELMKTQGLR
jgi:hypothetical protein